LIGILAISLAKKQGPPRNNHSQEQDHRGIKRITNPMMGFNSCND